MEMAGAGHFLEQSLEYHVGLHNAHRQRGVNRLQLGVLSVVMASASQSPDEQGDSPSYCDSLSQMSPLPRAKVESDVQSCVKQEQSAVLGMLPSVMGHCLK